MIPLGEDRYEARIVSDFRERGPYVFRLRGLKRGDDGKKSANANITVIHNSVVIHDDFELPRCTPGAVDEKEGEPAGLLLQDHANPVKCRNIWVKRL